MTVQKHVFLGKLDHDEVGAEWMEPAWAIKQLMDAAKLLADRSRAVEAMSGRLDVREGMDVRDLHAKCVTLRDSVMDSGIRILRAIGVPQEVADERTKPVRIAAPAKPKLSPEERYRVQVKNAAHARKFIDRENHWFTRASRQSWEEYMERQRAKHEAQ
jgi:hypothetical protein